LDQATVLIITDDAEFSRAITGRWQAERSVPTFTLMSGDLCLGADTGAFDLAVVGGLRPGILPAVLAVLESAARPVLLVATDAQTALAVRDSHPRILLLHHYEGWLDAAVLVGSEALRRAQAVERARQAESAAALRERHATLGRYMIEMRHSLNNALTSVLGNSELLLLEPGTLSATTRSQIDTIRNMTLRMHEILQRFYSLEKELSFMETQAQQEKARSHAAAYH